MKALALSWHQASIPRVLCEAETFAEWEEKAEAFAQYAYGCGNSSQRSLFDMLGQLIFLETHMPWSFFEKVTVRAIAADFTILKDSETAKLAEKHGGFWEEGYYMDDGYGWPVFVGKDGLERCFAFLKEWKKEKEQA
jgi:hypothetical protein